MSENFLWHILIKLTPRPQGPARPEHNAQGPQERQRLPEQGRQGQTGGPERVQGGQRRHEPHTDRHALLRKSRGLEGRRPMTLNPISGVSAAFCTRQPR